MEDKKLQSALYYLTKCGFSVIPCKENKTPYIQWQQYQKERPTVSQVEEWWSKKFKFANIGIVTGAISGLTVLDVDTKAGMEKLNELLPDSWLTPTVDTPGHGSHFYCKYEQGVGNSVRFIQEGCDVRSEGGYVIAPPSSDHRGAWKWRESCKIGKLDLNAVPEKVLSLILSFSSSLVLSSSFNILTHGDDNSNRKITPINFELGSRDNTLFHIANCLVKGGMPETEIEQLLVFIGQKCNPPFPEKELLDKVKSALKRDETRKKSLADEVREWVLSSSGVFLSSEVVKELGLSSLVVKNLSKILGRLCEEKLIEKHGDKRGCFRIIDRTVQEQCWWQDDGQPLPVKFPLDVHRFAKVFPGNIILLEGQKSQGKSAFALEFCRMNRKLYQGKILYQNVEMADSELIDRFRAYEDVMTLDEWRDSVTFIRQTNDWWDKVLPDGLNVIDYLIEYEKSYMIADFVWKIHQKMKNGIALIVVQRDPFKPYPAGGRAVRDIPRLVVSLIKHKIRLEDVKSFYKTEYGNPTGLIRKYKQVNWWNFKPDSDWELEMDEKYKDFEVKK